MNAPFFRTGLPQPNSFEKESIKRHAFHDQGVLVVSIHDHRLPWQERELLRKIGERLFGKSKQPGG